MSVSKSVRQLHRWVSMAFTLAVVANFIALWMGQQSTWIGIVALVPLFVLLFTGLYLFILPYRAKGRS
jgi:hypothetical protein